MAISFVGVGAKVGGDNPATLTPDKDVAGLAVGDLMIVAAASGAANLGFAWPAGWTEFVNAPDDGIVHSSGLAWRIYEAGDADPTVTLSGGAAGDTALAQVAVFRGVDEDAPIEAIGPMFTASSGIANIGPIPAITPVSAGSWVVAFGGKSRTWTSVATLSGDGLTWAEIAEPTETAGGDCSLVWDYATGWTSGALTAKTFTVTGGTTGRSRGLLFSLRPAGATGVVARNLTMGRDLADASSYATASIAPSAGKLLLIAVSHRIGTGTANVPTVTGCGVTWQAVQTGIATVNGWHVFRAMGTPTPGALTIDFGGQTQQHCDWVVDEFGGVDTSGSNGSGAIRQFKDGSSSASATVDATFDTTPATDSVVYAMARQNGNTDFTPGAAFTYLGSAKGATPVSAIGTEWVNNDEATASATFSATGANRIIAVEIAPASTGEVLMGAAALAGAGSLATGAVAIKSAVGALSGSGTQAAIAGAVKSGAAAIGGSGTLTASGRVVKPGAAVLEGTGDVASAGQVVRGGAGTLAGSGSQDAAAHKLAAGVGALSGESGAAFSAGPFKYAAAGLTGSGDVAATPIRVRWPTAVHASVVVTDTGSQPALLAAAKVPGPGGNAYLVAFSYFWPNRFRVYSSTFVLLEESATFASNAEAVAWAAANSAYITLEDIGPYVFGQANNHKILNLAGGVDGVFFEGDSTLEATPGRVTVATATLSGESTLNAIAAEPGEVFGAATLQGSGTQTATAQRLRTGEAALAGEGSLASVAHRLLLAQSALSASGALSASADKIALAAALLSGDGTLLASSEGVKLAAAALSGDGGADFTAQRLRPGAAGLSGEGSLSGAATTAIAGAAALSGGGSASASAQRVAYAAAALSASGSLTGSPAGGVTFAAAALAGAGGLVGDGFRVVATSAALAGRGDLDASGWSLKLAAAALSGEGALLIAGEGILFGAASFAGSGDLTASARKDAWGVVALSGQGGLTGVARAIKLASGVLAGEGNLAAAIEGIRLGSASLAGSGAIAASPRRLRPAQAAVSAQSTLIAGGLKVALARADVAGLATLGAEARALRFATALLSGAGVWVADGVVLTERPAGWIEPSSPGGLARVGPGHREEVAAGDTAGPSPGHRTLTTPGGRR